VRAADEDPLVPAVDDHVADPRAGEDLAGGSAGPTAWIGVLASSRDIH
jgi:hypothetical protein